MHPDSVRTAHHAALILSDTGEGVSLLDAYDPEYLDRVDVEAVIAGMTAREYRDFQADMFDYFYG